MAEGVLKKVEDFNVNEGKTTKEKVEKMFTDELIVGICSPIGSLKDDFINSLKSRLEKTYNYKVEVIKISTFILKHYSEPRIQMNKTEPYQDLAYKIKGGDFLRDTQGNNSILAELAIEEIRTDRGVGEDKDLKSRRICYIIDSLKNCDELNLLRLVYRDSFYMFSIFSPEKERLRTLIDIRGLSKPEAKELINTDDYEDILHGQDVRNTFVEGDLFVRITDENKKEIDDKVNKYCHLIFDSEIITPDFQETAMYQAKSAGGNSACLSRQVGAAIIDKNGLLLSTGWNDVPKFGGNLYNSSDTNDHRCVRNEFCTMVTHKNEIISTIGVKVDELIQELGVSEELNLSEKIGEIISKSKFKNIIEYSRSIHAEMHAIIMGSQLTGDKMVGGSLYCTTYPCHNCARHIILAGIKNIYYIEPYKKSLGIKLHGDALTHDESDEEKVRILLFDGVAPRRYLNFFSMSNDSRKNNKGELINKKINLKTINPKNRLPLQSLPALESQAVISLTKSGILQD